MELYSANLNWEEYSLNYPIRYLKQTTPFDTLVNVIASQLGEGLVLDVGGGKYGTSALRHQGLVLDALDPFVTTPASARKITWENLLGGDFFNIYDLIVCRGSLNYLNETELKALYGALKYPSGVLLANTFGKPVSKYVIKKGETAQGRRCTEIIQFDEEIGVVYHTLRIDGKDESIKHSFRYYSKEQLNKIWPNANPVYFHYGANSICVIIQKSKK